MRIVFSTMGAMVSFAVMDINSVMLATALVPDGFWGDL